MPGAISLAATHPGKIKNIIQSARSETSGPAEACILDFDKRVADNHDSAMQKVATTESEHFDVSHNLARAYRREYHLSPELSWVLTMSPLQAQMNRSLVSTNYVLPKFLLQYLINAVTFNYTTMHCKLNIEVMLIIKSGLVPVKLVLWIIVSFPSPHLLFQVACVRISKLTVKLIKKPSRQCFPQ